MNLGVIWIIGALICGAIAHGKGRSGVGFFLLSLIISPVIGLIVVLCAMPVVEQQTIVIEKSETSETKNCPFCAESIKADAIKCRFCQSHLSGHPEYKKTKPERTVYEIYNP